jgi:hypothetical protein
VGRVRGEGAGGEEEEKYGSKGEEKEKGEEEGEGFQVLE